MGFEHCRTKYFIGEKNFIMFHDAIRQSVLLGFKTDS